VAVEPADSCGRCELCLRGDQNLCPQVRFLGHPPVPGCLQEFLTHRAELLVELPDEISDEAGMVLEPLGVALHALRIGGVRPGGSAAVLGSGPIGLSCIMLLSRMGVSPVVATDLLDYRLAMAREFGARHTLNPARDDVPAAVHKLTNGRGVDYVLECAGAPEALMQSAEVAAVGGRVLVLGIPVKDEFAIRHTSARRKGLTVFMIRRSNLAARDCIQWTLQDRLPLARMVTHRWPLEKVQEAFETVAACADGVVKGAIRVSGG
jgi:L-iditol 2-dehydrogenase